MANHLGAADATEGTQGCHQVYGFEDICFALRIVAKQQMEARRKIRIQPLIVAEVSQSQMRQMHRTKLSLLAGERRDYSDADGQIQIAR